MSRDEVIKVYDALIEKCPDIERKGKTMPYTSDNGHMFTSVSKEAEIGMRFSKEVQEKYLVELDTTLFKSYGATMKGYIVIPESMYDDMDKMVALLEESHQYVLSLEPK